MKNIENAIIVSTHLGYEDHGIFTAYLGLKFGFGNQSFGGYALDKPDGTRTAASTRQGTEYGMETIIRIMRTVGVETWEKLKGQHVRVERDEGHVIVGIGHILEEKWFRPKTDLAHLPKEL